MQKFIHFSLVVAILLASMGFRVNIPHCSDEKGNSVSFFSGPNCCCNKKTKTTSKSCQDMSCIMQRGIATQPNLNSSTQQEAKSVKELVTYSRFAENIRPAILETLPHFTLPPPVSGRFIGILNQTFII